MEFNLENPLTNFNDSHSNAFTSLFLAESEHMPAENYFQSLKSEDFDISVRRETISIISQLSCNLDPLLSYLAINYLDRFLSSQGMLQPKPWILRLLAISCVSLAAKMKGTEFSLFDFQGDGGFIFDTQTIERMEVLILGALKWRMRSITPFSFISYFISLFKLKDPSLKQAIKARATEIIFKAQNGKYPEKERTKKEEEKKSTSNGHFSSALAHKICISFAEIKLLKFRPSIIAASALLSAAHELLPLQYPCFRKATSNCSYVNKENLFRCYNAMQDIVIDGYESVFDMVSSSVTPLNVLDQQFSSMESEKTNDTITSSSTSRSERDIKRRRIIGYCDNLTVQISRIQQC